MNKTTIEETIAWIDKRPNWLVSSINLLFKNNRPFSQNEINDLADKCIQEAKLKKGKTKIDKKAFSSYFGTNTNKGTVQLKSLSNIKGINNLNPKEPLELSSDNITIVYGRNGSGKSGYVRILKKACGARKTEDLLCDVFKGKESQECDFEIIKNGKTEKIKWKPQNKIENDLKTIDIFDTSSGISYVMENNEVTYEPPVLKFLTYLSETTDKVNNIVVEKINKLSPTLPALPANLQNTAIFKKHKSLSNTKEFDNDLKKTIWNKKKEKQQTNLEVQLVNSKNSDLFLSLKNQSDSIEKIIKKNQSLVNQLSLKEFREINNINKDIAGKQKQIKNSEKLLKGNKIDGITTSLWKVLWQAAREFSNNEAYPTKSFPNTENNARCVLCQQEISKDAITRFDSLETFIKNKFNTELNVLTENHEDKIENLPSFWEKELQEAILSKSSLSSGLKTEIQKSFENLKLRKESFKKAKKETDLVKVTDYKIQKLLKKELASIKKKLKGLETAKTSKGTKLNEDKILELKAEKWIVDNKKTISKALSDKESLANLNKAKSLCSTNALSTKKSDLAENLVTKEFIQNFEKELKGLGADNLNVTIAKSKTAKGKVYYAIKLKNSILTEKIENVLSEGEFRIVSLAAFLADVSNKAYNSPFIFDDPISSLDVDYEENTVKRIVELSKARQVIVFTHRLSFLSLLNDEANSQSVKTKNVTILSEYWGKGQPSRPLMDSQKPLAALNTLLDQRLTSAVKILQTIGTTEYLPISKSICSDFRITLERIIENDLLNQIVLRYRRGIQTKNRLHTLVKINQNDINLLDGMMSKYSIYEHSQSAVLPTKPIDPNDLKKDLEDVRDWILEFKKRK
jgi:energy-coupling factor transporter ATP-binding protein EcfA2